METFHLRAEHSTIYLENELVWMADENFESGVLLTAEWYLRKYDSRK